MSTTTDLQLEAMAGRRRGLLYHLRREPMLYLMLVPALFYLALFKYLPMYGVTVAFQDFRMARGYFGSRWVGFDQIARFLTDPFAYRVIRNTVILSFLSLVLTFPAPIVLALLLNEVGSVGYKRTIQTVSYLPHFISVVVIVGLLKTFFATDGIVNDMIARFGMEAQRYFIDPGWFRPLYVTSDIWQSMGWGSIIYLAALNNVNPELYEAAYVDGANRAQRMWNVTLPAMLPVIVIVLIFRLGNLMDVGFEKVFLMYTETTYEVADVIKTYTYRRGIQEQQFSYAAAVGLFESVINFLLIIGANYLSRRATGNSLW